MSEHPQRSADLVDARLPDGVAAPDGLIEAFWAYERALMANDLAELDRLFTDSADTIRGDAAGLLLGHERISSFRAGRGGAPGREIVELHVRPVDDSHAAIVAITQTPVRGRGLQTQLWSRGGDGWSVDVAQVGPPPPPLDTRVWVTVGSPLVAPGGSGPLDGESVAVKDLFAVAGHPVGAGVREYRREASVERENAAAVQNLLDSGAAVAGIAQTDQFAYSIAGANPQFGTPPNPLVPGAISGGSTSGPAAAVALGQATIALGTDTGGSVRVPASYQGLWGLRTTHGAVRRDGLLPLARSFDTVGWLTRDADTLRRAARVGLDAAPAEPRDLPPDLVIAPAVLDALEPDVRHVFEDFVAALPTTSIDVGDLDDLFELFRTVQALEAWRAHGEWITAHPGVLAADVASRFAWASTVSEQDETDARARLAEAASRIRGELGERTLLLPSASSIAPQANAGPVEIDRVRSGTLRLTAIAGSAGLPALSVPALTVPFGAASTAPVGLCLVGPRFSDLELIDRAEELLATR